MNMLGYSNGAWLAFGAFFIAFSLIAAYVSTLLPPDMLQAWCIVLSMSSGFGGAVLISATLRRMWEGK